MRAEGEKIGQCISQNGGAARSARPLSPRVNFGWRRTKTTWRWGRAPSVSGRRQREARARDTDSGKKINGPWAVSVKRKGEDRELGLGCASLFFFCFSFFFF